VGSFLKIVSLASASTCFQVGNGGSGLRITLAAKSNLETASLRRVRAALVAVNGLEAAQVIAAGLAGLCPREKVEARFSHAIERVLGRGDLGCEPSQTWL